MHLYLQTSQSGQAHRGVNAELGVKAVTWQCRHSAAQTRGEVSFWKTGELQRGEAVRTELSAEEKAGTQVGDSWQVSKKYTVARAVDVGERKERAVCREAWNGFHSSWGATEGN